VTRPARFTVGTFRVEPGRNAVIGPDGEAALEPKIMDVLCLLAAHPGEVLTREAIIDGVWGHAFGADESLTRAISHLRKTFGDARNPAQVIETISKRGYRLIAPVAVEETGGPSPRSSRRVGRWAIPLAILLALLAVAGWYRLRVPAPATTEDGLFVLIAPFDGGGANAHILSDQVAVALSRASLIHVQRTAQPPIEDRLAYAVHGIVQPLGRGVRVTIEVTDARGESLWAGNFDRPDAIDTPAQDELVGSIAGVIENRLLNAAKGAIEAKPAQALRPWELVLLATWVPGSDQVFLQPHTSDALWPQERALQLDPKYAPAHASLASALAYHALFTPDADVAGMRRAAAAHAEQAKALAPYDAGVLYELATYYRLIGDRASAQATLQRVIELQPDHPVARFDQPFFDGLCTDHSARATKALGAMLDRLAPDNPVRWVVLSHLADLSLAAGDYAGAADRAASSRQIVRMAWSGITLAAALGERGQDAEAARVARETKLEWPGLDWSRFDVGSWCMGGPHQAAATTAFRHLVVLEQGG